MKFIVRVDADGRPGRYCRKCMLVHDKVDYLVINRGGTAGDLLLLSLSIVDGKRQELFYFGNGAVILA